MQKRIGLIHRELGHPQLLIMQIQKQSLDHKFTMPLTTRREGSCLFPKCASKSSHTVQLETSANVLPI